MSNKKEKESSLNTEDSVSDLSSDGVEVEGVDTGADTSDMVVDDGSANASESITKQAFGFIANHLKVGADMTRMPIPATFVAPYSFLQGIQQQSAIYSHLLMSVPYIKCPEQRFLQVLRYHLTWPKMYFPKNPLNPIIGETYECSVQHTEENGNNNNNTTTSGEPDTTHFISEQVSHHPPISCFHFRNEKHGIRFDSREQITPVFKGKCIRATMDVKTCLTVENLKETYLNDKFPEGFLRILRWKFEFTGKYQFVCPETGITANINFKDKPLIGGKWHDIQIIVSRGTEQLYDIHGTHVDILTITNLKDKSSSVFLNYNTLRTEPVIDLPHDQLKENSSGKVWKGVCESLIKKDGRKAGLEKQKIEDLQRKKAKAHLTKDPNYHFKPHYFTPHTPDSPLKSDYTFNTPIIKEKEKELNNSTQSLQSSNPQINTPIVTK